MFPKFFTNPKVVATILQAIGCGIIALGAGMIWPPLGVILAGAGLVVFGLAAERGK